MSGRTFWFDASACSGCKACQVACKDKHDLPLGVRWRRVYEVAGGGWEREGDAWTHDVFAYNLSMACNHCAQPVCRDVCPTGAITRRDDGLVLIDAERCTGCRYCEWACPYGAPQYHAAAGHMTKCTFCVDEVDQGGRPACVDACGLRVLDFGTREELAERHGPRTNAPSDDDTPARPAFGSPYPLPDPGLTRPGLLVTPHAASEGAGGRGARVANREEVVADESGGRPRFWGRDRSLVAFTLLVQTAVGMAWALAGASWIGGPGSAEALHHTTAILVVLGVLLLGAAGVSLAHLGTPRNAWRAMARPQTSWLSREIILLMIFGELWALWMTASALGMDLDTFWSLPTAAAGAVLVYAMSRVYRLPTVPAWDTPLTPTAFFLTAGSLGGLAAALLMALGSGAAPRGLLAVVVLSLALELSLGPAWRAHRRTANARVDTGLNPGTDTSRGATSFGVFRPGLLMLGVIFALGAWWLGGVAPVALALVASTLAAVQGRAVFYDSRARVGL